MEATEQVVVSKHDVAFFGADLFRNKGSVVITEPEKLKSINPIQENLLDIWNQTIPIRESSNKECQPPV